MTDRRNCYGFPVRPVSLKGFGVRLLGVAITVVIALYLIGEK